MGHVARVSFTNRCYKNQLATWNALIRVKTTIEYYMLGFGKEIKAIESNRYFIVGEGFGVGEQEVAFSCVGVGCGAVAEIAPHSRQGHNCGHYKVLFHCNLH